MPNWCNNTVEIYHPDTNKLKALVEAFNKGEMCNYIKPVPDALRITAGFLGDGEEQRKLEEQTAQNLVDHGYGNWYDFCVNEWGTKWDVGGDGMEVDPATVETDVTLSFDSAWSPPINIYEAMVEQGFSVRAYYYEPGMNFAGIWWDGDDDFYELAGSSEDVKEQIPEALDEMFGITESMEMWEEENKEEEEE